ncbi:Cytochrome c556 [Devosia enhydra]|uniref:Cytochrome c556 n=1 Tax=Devosia enhydra TaxID=665118 RepID=A0A1K2I3P1_9HYPH|nr:cytochrome c [Devosia enhydra]SFZ86847.1 Cytochrome c556 [Devosia enhydra]
MRRQSLIAIALGALVLAAGTLPPTLAQNTPAPNAPAPEMTALTSQKDTTLARRLLMNSIGANNDIVHDILDGALPADDLELRGRLDSIAAMLYAMPSLYRAAPNPYTEEGEREDATHVSLASEAVWEYFEDFQLRSEEAFLKAREAAQAHPEDMLARVEELEMMCESCHESFRKPFEYFDFDRVQDFVK